MPRLWVPLDVNFWLDPDVLSCSPSAQLLFVRSLCVAKATSSNGYVAKILLPQLASGLDVLPSVLVADLLAAGLWREETDGYAIPSWPKHNRSATETRILSETRARAGRRGGLAKAERERSNLLDEVASNGQDPALAEKSREEKSREGHGAQARARTRGTRVPDPFDVSDAMASWAHEQFPAVAWSTETEKFLDYWRGRSGAAGLKVDWQATWRNWIRRAAEGVR